MLIMVLFGLKVYESVHIQEMLHRSTEGMKVELAITVSPLPRPSRGLFAWLESAEREKSGTEGHTSHSPPLQHRLIHFSALSPLCPLRSLGTSAAATAKEVPNSADP